MNLFKNRKTSPPLIPAGHGGLVEKPTDNDVLCGRGKRVNGHVGNVYFRDVVRTYKLRYLATSKVEKSLIAADVVDKIRGLDPPGRFLKEDGKSSSWIEIGDEKARKKAGQALREDAPEIRTKMEPDAIPSTPTPAATTTTTTTSTTTTDGDGVTTTTVTTHAAAGGPNDRRLSTLSMDSSLVALLRSPEMMAMDADDSTDAEDSRAMPPPPRMRKKPAAVVSASANSNASIGSLSGSGSGGGGVPPPPTPPPSSSTSKARRRKQQQHQHQHQHNKPPFNRSSIPGEVKKLDRSPVRSRLAGAGDDRRRSSITMDSGILQALLTQNYVDEASVANNNHNDPVETLSAKMRQQSIAEEVGSQSAGVRSESELAEDLEEDLEKDLEAIKSFVQRLPNMVSFTNPGRASMMARRESHSTMSIDSTIVETMLRRSFVHSKRRNSEMTVESYLQDLESSASMHGRNSMVLEEEEDQQQQHGGPSYGYQEGTTLDEESEEDEDDEEDDDDDDDDEGDVDDDDVDEGEEDDEKTQKSRETQGDYKRQRRYSQKVPIYARV